MEEIKVVGKNVYLRPITHEDTDIMVKWRNEPEVFKYFIYRRPFTREGHEEWLRTRVETGEVVQFIACDNADGRPIGCTYLRDITESLDSAEYGVLIGDADNRGHGLGKELLSLTMKYGFEDLGLKKITARVISSNAPSVYCFLHSGFNITEKTSQLTIPDGEEIPVTMLEITRETYEEG